MKKMLLINLLLFTSAWGAIDSQLEHAIKSSDKATVEALLKTVIANDNDKAYYLSIAEEVVKLKRNQRSTTFLIIPGQALGTKVRHFSVE